MLDVFFMEKLPHGEYYEPGVCVRFEAVDHILWSCKAI